MRRFLFGAVLLFAGLFFSSCRVDKYIRPDDKLLRYNEYVIQTSDSLGVPKDLMDACAERKKYTVQNPNKTFLITDIRLQMRIFCLSNPSRKGMVANYLRKSGEAPVVYSESATKKTVQQLQNMLVSKGCFQSKVSYDTIHGEDHDLTVRYYLRPSGRFRIGQVTYSAKENDVLKLLYDWAGDSYLHLDDFYDQDNLAKERDRIASNLRNQGYFLASTDLISFLVDTLLDEHQLSIDVMVKSPKVVNADKKQVTIPLRQYRLSKIYVYPNSNNSLLNDESAFDTTRYYRTSRSRQTEYIFVHDGNLSIRPRTIANSMYLFQGQLFRQRSTERTYNSLLGLRNYKYIDIEYSESPLSTDSLPLLDARVRLLPTQQRKISLSVEANNASPFGRDEADLGFFSGNVGLQGGVGYQNKNLFGNAELLKVDLTFLSEVPKGVFKKEVEALDHMFSTFEMGLDVSLDLPNTLLLRNREGNNIRPHIVLNIGGDYQYREYFRRNLFNTSAGISWVPSSQVQHQFLPIEITYAKVPYLSEEYQQRLQGLTDARLKYQYSDHLIMAMRYDYTFSNQQIGTRNDFSYLRLSAESAGNALYGFCKLTNRTPNESGMYSIANVFFAQYLRVTAEAKRYFYINQKSTFVARAFVGLGLPYQNSAALPYERSFFGGGPSNNRAWNLRHLGPGLYSNTSEKSFERVGDFSLIVNLEQRFPLFSIFEGAFFVDMGNVWLYNKSEEFPGGEFRFNTFLKSIAVGTGLGLRANVSIITLRVDVGFPVYDPGYGENERFRLQGGRISPVFNIGADYPF